MAIRVIFGRFRDFVRGADSFGAGDDIPTPGLPIVLSPTEIPDVQYDVNQPITVVGGAALLKQVGFRFRADNGDETGAAWLAAENTDLSAWETLDTNFRLRFVVEQSAAGVSDLNVQLRIQYRLNGGSWVSIIDEASRPTVNARDSIFINDVTETPTTRQLTSGTGSFFTGGSDNFDGIIGKLGQLDFVGQSLTELEYNLRFVAANATDLDEIEFRLVRQDGTPLDVYSQIPKVILSVPGNPPVEEPPPGEPGTLVGRFVAVNGSASAPGTEAQPWSLRKALTLSAGEVAAIPTSLMPDGQGGTVAARVIWVKEGGGPGTGYDLGELAPGTNVTTQGTATNPVIIRAYPLRSYPVGNYDIIARLRTEDGVSGHVWFWGFRTRNTLSMQNRAGWDMHAPGSRIINCWTYDWPGNAFGHWGPAHPGEIHGSVGMFSGWYGSSAPSSGHGTYLQNDGPEAKIVDQNVLAFNFGFGNHAYTSAGLTNNIVMDDGITFQNGIGEGAFELFYLMKGTQPGIMRRNIVYTTAANNKSNGLQLSGSNYNGATPFVFEDNWIWFRRSSWLACFESISFKRNHIFSRDTSLPIAYIERLGMSYAKFDVDDNDYRGPVGNIQHRERTSCSQYQPGEVDEIIPFATWKTRHGKDTNSTYNSALPTTNHVAVIRNRYEARGWVVVMNFQGLTSQAIDVSAILAVNDKYEIRNVQRPGTVVASGTYTGGTLSFPLTQVTISPTPTFGQGDGAPPSIETFTTGSEFHCFLLAKTGSVATPPPPPPPPPPGGIPDPDVTLGYFVTATATGSGTGTSASPWTIRQAAAQGSALQGQKLQAVSDGAGGTIQATIVWIKGGTYDVSPGGLNVTTSGTPTNPVIFRRLPGTGRAKFIAGAGGGQGIKTINTTSAPDTWWWGLEVTYKDLTSLQNGAFQISAPRSRLIHNVAHDVSGSGVGWWAPAWDSHMFGNIIYNVGWDSAGANAARTDHGTYSQSGGPAGSTGLVNSDDFKHSEQNVCFQTFGYGLHEYSTNSGLDNFTHLNDVVFNNGFAGGNDFFIGGSKTPIYNVTYDACYSYRSTSVPGTTGNRVGYGSGTVVNPTGSIVKNCYWHSSGTYFLTWDRITATNNIFATNRAGTVVEITRPLGYSAVFTSWTFNNNAYYRVPATGGNQFRAGVGGVGQGTTYSFAGWQGLGLDTTGSSFTEGNPPDRVFVHASKYQKNRGMIVIYNWSGAATKSVDVSSILAVGAQYEIREVQRYYNDPPALAGTYAGGNVTLSMATVTAPTPPSGNPAGTPPPTPYSTGTAFHVFIVMPPGDQ